MSMLGLEKSYGKGADRFKAVDNLSLNFYKAEVCAFLGHNGSGKTTTINMMTGIVRPEKGDCVVDGASVLSEKGMAYIRSITGVCMQHNVQYPYLTARENLELVARLRYVDDANSGAAPGSDEALQHQIDTILDELELTSKANEQAQHLSGGQQRKLTVAMALVGDPKLILLDEPTANLDSSARHAVWRMIAERQRQGRAIVLTTHHSACACCETVYTASCQLTLEYFVVFSRTQWTRLKYSETA